MNYRDIITREQGKLGGKPCIRGLRITVDDVLSYLVEISRITDHPLRVSQAVWNLAGDQQR